MSRLDIERQNRLEPKRIGKALSEFRKMGLPATINGKSISFIFKGETVTYYPYSGWATGKSIKDGRGFKNLLNQLKDE